MGFFNLTNFEGMLSTQGCGGSHTLGHCDIARSAIHVGRLKSDKLQAHKHCGLGEIQIFLLGETTFELRYSAT